MFSLEQARKDGNLVRALMWLGKDNEGNDIFRWTSAVIQNGPDTFGSYQVMQLSSGRYGTTDKLQNITYEKKVKTFAKMLAE